MMTRTERFQEAMRLRDEIKHTANRVAINAWMGVATKPEDFVVLRGSTEALIELAETAPTD